MKMVKHFLVLAIMAIVMTSLASCSKDDKPSTDNKARELSLELKAKVDKIDTPEALKNNQDTNAQNVSNEFEGVKALSFDMVSGWLGNVPDNTEVQSVAPKHNLTGRLDTQALDGYTYTWNYGSMTVHYTINETSDRYEFKYHIIDREKNYDYAAFTGYYLKDGSYAEFNMNKSDNTSSYTIKCWFNSDKSSRGEVYFDGKLSLEIYSKADYSGYIKFYDDSKKLSYEAHWNADGSGYIKYYNSDGTVYSQENWN